MPQRKPRFLRQESWRLKRVRESWRRPKGVTSRMRKEKAGWPRRAKVGYGVSSSSKGLHPRGLSQRRVEKLSDMEGLNPKSDILFLSRRLGERRRLMLLERAKELGLRVANPGKGEVTPSGAEEPAERPEKITEAGKSQEEPMEESPEESASNRKETGQ